MEFLKLFPEKGTCVRLGETGLLDDSTFVWDKKFMVPVERKNVECMEDIVTPAPLSDEIIERLPKKLTFKDTNYNSTECEMNIQKDPESELYNAGYQSASPTADHCEAYTQYELAAEGDRIAQAAAELLFKVPTENLIKAA